MASSRLLLSILCIAGLSVPAGAQTPGTARWCAEPRTQDPLLRDAKGLINRNDTAWATTREVFEIPLVPEAKIDVVRDEVLCHRSAVAYGDHIRRVADENWADKPVLVVRVGDMYLVDDQSSREEGAYWTVLLVDKNLSVLVEYGGGS